MKNHQNDNLCSLYCKSFKCNKRALKVIKKEDGRKTFLCKLEEDECIGYMCNYAECFERKMADDGRCLKPKITQSKSKPQSIKFDDYNNFSTNDLDEKVLKKLNKKL